MKYHLIDVYERVKNALRNEDVNEEEQLLETFNVLVFMSSCLMANFEIEESKYLRLANIDMERLQRHTGGSPRLH